MSVYLKPGQLKIKDENGDYTGINTVALESTAEYLEQIETKGDQIMDDIEAKGEETLESIPDDYTALSEEVSELNERLTYGEETATYIQGQRNLQLVINPSTKRCTTYLVYDLKAGDAIYLENIDSGLKANIAAVNNGSLTYDSGWKTSNFKYVVTSATEGKYWTEVIKSDNSDITPSDIQTMTLKVVPTTVYALKRNVIYRPVSQLTVNDFQNGSIANGEDDAWRRNQRIATPVLYALNDIQIESLVATYPNAVFSVASFLSDGTFLSGTAWLKDYVIKKDSIFRLVCDINPQSSATFTVGEIYEAYRFGSPKSSIRKYTKNDNLVFLFQKGSMSYGEYDSWRADSRAITIDKLVCDHDILIKYKSGDYTLAYFDNTGTFTEAFGWLNNDRIIPANTVFRILIAVDKNSATYQTLTDLCETIELSIIDKNEFGLNPNIIFQCRNVDDTAYPPYSKWYVKAAAENQYDRVRFVVRQTTDGEFVLIHDDTINNVAVNPDGTAISGAVTSTGHTLAELNEYDWGLKFGQQYAGATVPTLEEGCKYASLYNLGVTIEHYITQSDANISAIISILAKYGLIENFMLIASGTVSAGQISSVASWIAKSEYVSPVFGGKYALLSQFTEQLNALKTGKNTIYCVGIGTWGSEEVDKETRDFVISNGWSLYSSNAMTKAELFNKVGFDKGYTLIEANNVYMVKDTVRAYANEQVAGN